MESNGTDQRSRAGTGIENQVETMTGEVAAIEGGIMIVGAAGIGIGTVTEKGTETPIVLVAMIQEVAEGHAHGRWSDQGIMFATGTFLDLICLNSCARG